MARHATWIRRPEDPKSPAGWIVWGDRQLPDARRQTFRRLMMGTFTLAVGLAFVNVGVALLFAFLALVGLAVYARPGAREHAAVPSMVESAFPVTLDVRVRGRRAGRENGWVAFVDGWLVYEGLRTSFASRPTDAEARSVGGELYLQFRDGLSVRMFLLTDPMQTSRPGKRRDGARLLEAFDAWRKAPAPEGVPVLPPLDLSARMAGELIGERIVLTGILGLLGVFAALSGLWAALVLVVATSLVILADAFVRTRRLRRQLTLPPERSAPHPCPSPPEGRGV